MNFNYTVLFVAVSAVILGFVFIHSSTIEKVVYHRIIVTGTVRRKSEIEAISIFLAEQYNISTENVFRTSDENHASKLSLLKISSWILYNDDDDDADNDNFFKNLNDEFMKTVSTTSIIILENNIKELESDDDKHLTSYQENVLKWIHSIETSCPDISIIRVDTSKPPDEIKEFIKSEIHRHDFLAFYSKYYQCGSLCKAF